MIARRCPNSTRGERADEWTVAISRGFDPYNTADLPHVISARNERLEHVRELMIGSFKAASLDELAAALPRYRKVMRIAGLSPIV